MRIWGVVLGSFFLTVVLLSHQSLKRGSISAPVMLGWGKAKKMCRGCLSAAPEATPGLSAFCATYPRTHFKQLLPCVCAPALRRDPHPSSPHPEITHIDPPSGRKAWKLASHGRAANRIQQLNACPQTTIKGQEPFTK